MLIISSITMAKSAPNAQAASVKYVSGDVDRYSVGKSEYKDGS